MACKYSYALNLPTYDLENKKVAISYAMFMWSDTSYSLFALNKRARVPFQNTCKKDRDTASRQGLPMYIGYPGAI